ncbi:probable aminotransferase TAT2 [Tripterygium wilfordii]|uniref:probable aminotransferase TAT2 n=1 Tax=Tripterygium wilfordii TaxID=458696 RepID=UPI0018F85ABB|nr:probable aminotransferase TAT2 [Tripterygium wilfordii]
MENGAKKFNFQATQQSKPASAITVRKALTTLTENLNKDDRRTTIALGAGDPSLSSCFRTTSVAEDAIVDAVRSATYNCYAPTAGLLSTRSAVADYLNRDLTDKLSPDDVFVTLGCKQAIEVIISVLARPGANILLPKPCWPFYEARAAASSLEVRHFDLLPERDWEVDLEAVEALADDNTGAMVVINPGNPCGNVYSHEHLKKIAETARKLGIFVISDEVYGHLAFGSNPFVPMGAFGSIVSVITLGSISKRWVVPGWRLGWLVTNDPNGILQESGIVESIKGALDLIADPPTFIQGAIPQILENTKDDFFLKIINLLREAADTCYDQIKEIPGITCPKKPEGSMFLMVKLNLSLLEGIADDMDFCLKLVQEESVIILPGITVGMKNWLRITIATDPSTLEEGLERVKTFCLRHSKK